jgi:hypothetical protein
MSWKPLGKYALVRLHTQGSVLELTGDVQYNGLATVLAVGDEVKTLAEGDVVLLNGPAGIIAAKTLEEEVGPHTGLVAVPLVLARREREWC